MSVNSCHFIGNLGREPETRYTTDGTPVCTFSIAATEKWKSKSGEAKEHTEWVTCVAWRQLAEICGKYLVKGQQVYVEGKMQTRSWETEDGTKKYRTEVILNTMRMLGKKDGNGNGSGDRAFQDDASVPGYVGGGVDIDDLPF